MEGRHQYVETLPFQWPRDWIVLVCYIRLWAPIPTEKRETIRGFLTSFHCEVLKRAHKRFNFRNGSIGNFFLTGARLFFGSLEAALFLFKAITGISELTAVVPVINTNHTATIAAQLANGTTLAGQNEISHPPPAPANGSRRPVTPGCRWTHSNPIDAFSHLALGNEDESPISPEAERNSNLFFSKHVEQKLESPIERIYYINQYGQEIYPVPNPKVISQLSSKRTLIYSIGSLYTSIVPCLILRSIGNAIAHSTSLKQKILLLNGSNDRETSGYTALDFIKTITDALNQSRKIDARRAFYQSCTESELSAVASTVVSGSSSSTTTTDSGSFAGTVPSSCNSSGFAYAGSMPGTPPHNYPPFPDHQFVPDPPSSFITHLVYLENGLIPVDVDAIVALGIQCVKISGSISSTDGYPIYDESILSETIRRITEQVQ